MIKIEVTSNSLGPALERLVGAAVDLTPLMMSIAEELRGAVEENFEAQGRPAWAPLSETTKSRRRGEGAKILQDSGQLASSITVSHDATNAAVGTNKVYGPTQQFGAKKGEFGVTKRGAPIPWGDIPARPFLSVTEEDKEAIVALTEDYLRRALNA